jgi:hypothetical protein
MRYANPYPFPLTLSLILGEHLNVTAVLASKGKSSTIE